MVKLIIFIIAGIASLLFLPLLIVTVPAAILAIKANQTTVNQHRQVAHQHALAAQRAEAGKFFS